ncbi:MAG TPA: HNH endonuclease [Brevibacterium senegalense]|uniref:HNH endonuclease n=1 Tax=Brevibacterium senegalense TaxID=1033736 RepID=A0A921MCV2_9MICO|nr:HNH endonuclease [Brevibacterium senegalense]
MATHSGPDQPQDSGDEPTADARTAGPRFRTAFSDHDRDVLSGRAPHYVHLLDTLDAVVDDAAGHRSLGAQEALAGLKALEQARRHVERLSTDLLAHYERVGDPTAHGYRSVVQLLEGEFRIPSHEARRRTQLSTHLTDRVSTSGEPLAPLRPSIARNFAEGRLSSDEARTLCRAVDDLPPTIKAQHAHQIEKTLVNLSPTVRVKDIPKLSQRIIEHLDPDGKLPQYETDPMAYTVTLNQKPNGDWKLSGLLDSPTGTTLQALLMGRMKDDALIPVVVRSLTADRTAAATGGDSEGTTAAVAEDAKSADDATEAHSGERFLPDEYYDDHTAAAHTAGDDTAPHNAGDDAPHFGNGVHEDGCLNTQSNPGNDRPPPGVARHDRLAFLLRSVTRERVLHGADHALVVSATPDDLTNPRRTLSTQFGGPISLSSLEGWSNAAQTFAHITEGGGRTLEILSHGRFATRTQIAVLTARDQGCTFPDCDAPPHWCEAHHMTPYSQGGETTVDNLTLVCPFHHRWHERTGWTTRFHRGLPAWKPPRSIDPQQRLLFHSRFRAALLDLPPTLLDTT